MTHDHHTHDTPASGSDWNHPATAEEWDERYRTADNLWTTNVNPALIAEVDELAPGRALDLGCGEGADVRWLADKGWTVTGADISQVALDRAAAVDSRETITWKKLDVTSDDVAPDSFDLVSLSYFGIFRDDVATARKIIDAVAPGGTLLFVGHDPEGMRAHGAEPDRFFWPDDLVAMLDGWTVVTNDNRERPIPAGGGAHIRDVVLRAVRPN